MTRLVKTGKVINPDINNHNEKHHSQDNGSAFSQSDKAITPTMGFLDALPDSCVSDPHCELTEGIAELQCPYNKRGTPGRILQ